MGAVTETGNCLPKAMEKPTSAKSKASTSSGHRDNSPPKSAGSKSSKKSPSPSRKAKNVSPNRKSGGELKSAMRKSSGKEKGKKKTVVKSPDLTADGLKIVDMSGQGMTVLPLSVVGAKDTGELCLASNNLRSLPPELRRLTTLTKLDISRNGIRCTNPNDFSGLPTELKELVNLVELRISECNLPYIPPAIWQLVQLKILDISRNKINMLQPEIGNLTNLQKLNLQQTNITTLPPEIAYCQELEEILLWGNVIESLPETLPEMLKLRTLAVNYRSFCAQVDSFQESEELLRKGKLTSEHIPLVVFELATLEVLDLENTKINNIPDMSNISLRELYVCKNFLSKVPPSLFNLNHLTMLDMSNNLLNLLPEDIGRVTSLVNLRLSSNRIERIPARIRELVNLQELNLADNRIRFMPTAIGGLKKLKTLLIEKNELSCLPDELCELQNLETLDITENRITALPMKMHKLKNLVTAHSFKRLSKYGLWLYKNPIHQPPPEIWKTDHPTKIFEYLKKLAIIKTENLQRQKLLFFGASGSGKTSLINGLIHRKSLMTRGEGDKTRALVQTPWKTENNVEFMINDFGGDSAYTMIYPMFSDTKGMVLLVYNHGSYSTDTHYNAIGQWLEFLSVHMPGVVVKLVGTHLDTYEEFAIEDENGNISQTPDTLSRTSSRSSKSPRRSQLSLHSGRSLQSAASSTKDEPMPNLDLKDMSLKEMSTPTPISRASSYIGLSKSVEELVKTNVERQMQQYAQLLQHEFDELEQKIKSGSDGKRSSQYIKHLQIQKNQLEFLINNPLRIIPDISLVSNNEGLYGVSSLIESVELMVIDKSLFPFAQRSVPKKWNKMRLALKKHKDYFLPWKQVMMCGKETEVTADELTDCLQYLHDTGEILWFKDIPALSKKVFQKPRILVKMLASIFRHDMEAFLDFEVNKVFLSKGMFSREDFENAKLLFLRNGQISRPLMNCFWFYEELDYEQFNNLVDLAPTLDICYSVPEPTSPTGLLYSYPIVVLPWYNLDKAGQDFAEYWNEALAEFIEPVITNVTYVLPLGLPAGLFEKLSSALQTHATTRIDWKDSIFATTQNEIFKIALSGNTQKSVPEEDTGDIPLAYHTENLLTLTIAAATDNKTGATTLLKEMTRMITDLLARAPGLVWNLEVSDELWFSSNVQYALKSVQFSK
ncbi:malignant fibrous histiocytoma-amplified sequence 1 homolog isoform X2 [Ruditapes philippinarum]|uniref:malignant fibrous histiocytoma-amplified sequence 1 homolog isoform X2 n=1 Tax=Ruditapes philippinarum TaxID=129788 RepID=UPI00295C0EE4|nr:malignant fibrous histiocytoma-amplified sequence 1 homolog isoform X2 [Ruditapes philippinarum]